MSKNKKQIELSDFINDLTYTDYLNRLTKICLSIFEWVNLPSSMNAIKLEKSLFYYGQASLLKDDDFGGFINTNCSNNGNINLYDLPTDLYCYSNQYHSSRKLYTGLNIEDSQDTDCILVQNNWERVGTYNTIQLFAYRLYECQRTLDINLNAQKTPFIIITNQSQLLSMKNLFNQIEDFKPKIFADKDNLDENTLRVLKTDAPFLLDKISSYKKEIWNECLTFLGINNIIEEKKERMINDEVNSNNELINLNLQSYLAPRQLACI